MRHEHCFKELRSQHQQADFKTPAGCGNLKRNVDLYKEHSMKDSNILNNASDSKLGMNRLTSFTLTGNSSLHFELSSDPTELIGAIFWQLKRIKIEKHEPIVVGGGGYINPLGEQSPTSAALGSNALSPSFSSMSSLSSQSTSASAESKEAHRILQEDHNLPIQKMGDIESYLKHKFDLETNVQFSMHDRSQSTVAPSTYYLRDAMLSDEQNQLLHRPYCGNPFVAPGTVGSKTRRKYHADG